MEYWNAGKLGFKSGMLAFSKETYILLNPSFQYCMIPLFQLKRSFDYAASLRPKTYFNGFRAHFTD